MKNEFPPHISLDELTTSQYATRHSIDNTPNEEQLRNLIKIAWFLETLRGKIRDKIDKNAIIIISSGLRVELLNTGIGGSRTSSHVKGLAADIKCNVLTPLELAEFIRDNMSDEGFDQVIHEFGRWVHVGLTDNVLRFQTLTASKRNGKTHYESGLHEVAA